MSTRCPHCHRPPVAKCDGRGTVESAPCVFGACPNDIDMRHDLWAVKRARDPVATHWLDCRGRANDKFDVLAVGDVDTPWVIVLTDQGQVKCLAKSRVTSLVTE